jgi:hypothetical protein
MHLSPTHPEAGDGVGDVGGEVWVASPPHRNAVEALPLE